MSPMRDATTGSLVRSEELATGAASDIYYLELNGTALNGLSLLINVPGTTQGCAPLLSVTVHASSTSAAATTDPIIAMVSGIAESTTETQYILPFSTSKRAVCFRFDVAGGSTPGFSAVSAWIVQPVNQKWTRGVEFV